MKRVGYALFLLTVYLLSIGGMAGRVLTCDCVVSHFAQREAGCRHHCTHCQHHAHDAAAELAAAVGMAMQAPCCDDRHDTRPVLYVAAQDDDDAQRLLRQPLPVQALAADGWADLPDAPCRTSKLPVRIRQALPDARTMLPAGLRAPPVTV